MRTTEVCRLSGATYRQVDYWARLGILTQPRAPGIGVHRVWSLADAHRIRLVAQAVRAGMLPSPALRLAAAMDDDEVVSAPGLQLSACA